MLKEKVNTVYELDLLGTAKTKYWEELGSKAAFILHSDSPDYDFWGAIFNPLSSSLLHSRA